MSLSQMISECCKSSELLTRESFSIDDDVVVESFTIDDHVVVESFSIDDHVVAQRQFSMAQLTSIFGVKVKFIVPSSIYSLHTSTA